MDSADKMLGLRSTSGSQEIAPRPDKVSSRNSVK